MKTLLLTGLMCALSAVAQPPKFEVASVRPCEPVPDAPGVRDRFVRVTPERLNVSCMPLLFLIRDAYVRSRHPVLKPADAVPIAGAPPWVEKESYDIEAKATGNPTAQTMEGPMLQALLEDRFKLRIHRETKEVPVYELTVAKGGFKLQPMKDGECSSFDPLNPPDFVATPASMLTACGATRMGGPREGKPAFVDYFGMTLDEVVTYLVRVLDRPVINTTGIAGTFHVGVDFAPDGVIPKFAPAVTDDPSGPSIFTAFQEQLGLKLEPAKGPGEFLVIDSVERPTEN